MRSAAYCDQFRRGQLDSIEFSVSKGGHYYEFPESGCVVASVKPLRRNRYAVDADCIEGGERFQQSLILDVEGTQTIRIDGEELTSCDLKTTSDKTALRSPEHLSKAEVKSAALPKKLIRQWEVANENCRGGSGDDPKTLKACDVREKLARQLEAAKWCYGKEGQSGYQYTWHRCQKGSIHH
jgi:hypothetical protein